jgi:hypothetical protein
MRPSSRDADKFRTHAGTLYKGARNVHESTKIVPAHCSVHGRGSVPFCILWLSRLQINVLSRENILLPNWGTCRAERDAMLFTDKDLFFECVLEHSNKATSAIRDWQIRVWRGLTLERGWICGLWHDSGAIGVGRPGFRKRVSPVLNF